MVPVYLAGHNSRLFQLASSVHSNLHFALLIKEFKTHIDEPVQAVIRGADFINAASPFEIRSNRQMDYLREATYRLSPALLKSYGNGYEFEAEEVARCVRAGKIESDIIPHSETMALMETMDAIRAQCGIKYPME